MKVNTVFDVGMYMTSVNRENNNMNDTNCIQTRIVVVTMFCVALFRTFLCTNSIVLTLVGSVWFLCMMHLSRGTKNGNSTLSSTEVFCILWLLAFVAVQGMLLHDTVKTNELLSEKEVQASYSNTTNTTNNSTGPALGVKITLEEWMHIPNETRAKRQYATTKGLLSSWALWIGHAVGCMYTIFIGTAKNNSETCVGCTVCMCILHCNCASLFEFALAGTPDIQGIRQDCSMAINLIFWCATFICICIYTMGVNSQRERALQNRSIVPLQNLEHQQVAMLP